jgi:3-oxoacyl-[acyl-carrier-protein] synthase II
VRGGRRVAVTGLGVVAPAGMGAQAFWQGLLREAPVGQRRIDDWDPTPWFGPKEARRTDRFAQFAVAAATEAVDSAGPLGADLDRSGVVIATGVGGLHTLEEQIVIRHEKGEKRVSPFLVPMMMCNAAAGNVSMRFGWRGPCETIVTACAASTQAIGYAARLIAMGVTDAMLAGGSETAITPTGVAGFRNMTAMSSSGISRPFDVERDGFVISEGAAVLVLEAWDDAVRRGATILGEVLGTGSTADAYHITAPSPDGSGAVRAMEQALVDAGLAAGDIVQINAHGTSTPLNDMAEGVAINKVFGHPGPPVTSTKGVTGHALGGAGALEAAAVLLSMEHRLIPPTMGLVDQDPEIQLDVVRDAPRPWAPGPTLSNSFGFGGHNGTLVIGPPPA